MAYLKQLILVGCASGLFLIIGLMQINYRFIALENNQLYTKPTTQKIAAFKSSSIAVEPTNVFRTIGPNIRAFYSTHYDQLRFPLYEGRLFTEANTSEALVGAQVKTKMIAGKEYVEVAGSQYQVIGKLGRTPESNLYMTVLINENQFFSEANTVITLDTHFADPLFQLDSQALNHYGTRDGSQAFFLNVNWFALLLFTGTIGVITLLFERQFRYENQILFLSGWSRKQLLISNLWKIGGSVGSGLLGVYGALFLFSVPQLQHEFLLFSLIFLSGCLITYTTVIWKLEAKVYGVLS
ncbi:MAG: hypothetical protein ACRC6H_09510 [Culicoidibacterales bacterium]